MSSIKRLRNLKLLDGSQWEEVNLQSPYNVSFIFNCFAFNIVYSRLVFQV